MRYIRVIFGGILEAVSAVDRGSLRVCRGALFSLVFVGARTSFDSFGAELR